VSEERGSRLTDLMTALKTGAWLGIEKVVAWKYPFESLTLPAKRTLILAQDEAERMDESMDDRHLLLGLARDPDGVASKILDGFGLEIDAARAMLGRELSLTARLRRLATSRTRVAIEKAFDQKRRTGKSEVGTEDLLVGILLEDRGDAALVLARSGVTLERTRERVADLLAQGISDSSRNLGSANLALENLSFVAESALTASAREAAEFGAKSFGSDHLLLGILSQTGSMGARVLTELGITSEAMRARLRRARAREPGAETYMTEALRVELRKTFLAPRTDLAIDTSALVLAVLAGGGLGGAILGGHSTRQKLDQVVASLPSTELAEAPIGRFSKALHPLWNERALCRIWAGRYADAGADYFVLRAKATSPLERAEYANNLAWVNLVIGDGSLFAESLALAEEAAASSPDSRASRSTLAFALIENGRSREGVEILEALGSEDGDKQIGAELAALLAVGKWRTGKRDRALALLQRAAELDPQCILLPRVRAEFEPTPG